jgi:hypothetical protein
MTDSLGLPADSASTAYPQGLAGFINPSAGNYVDGTGALRYARTNDQLAADRAAWISTFDRNKTATAYAKGDMTEYSPEARAAHIAKFDTAAMQDGYSPVEPISAETRHAADLSMVNLDPRPGDYTVDLGAIPNASPDTATEIRGLLTELQFLPGLGNGLAARLVQVSAARKEAQSTPEAWAAFADSQRAALLQRAGSEAALNEQISAIQSMLRSVRGSGAKLARATADSAPTLDGYTFSMLLTHARGRAQFYRS